MPSLEAIQAKIQRLQEQAEAIKAKQASATLGRIVELMSQNGISVADIEAYVGNKKGGARHGKPATTRTSSVAAKYQDPKTGAIWSGRGRAPGWIANAKNRDRFLVDGNAVMPSTSAVSKVKKQGKYIRGPQPAKYLDPETGATWSGRGRAPAWIANATDRSKFSIAADEKAEATGKTTLGKAKSRASSIVASSGPKGPPKGKQPAKYINPETGATWSGRGPAPAWLAGASDRSKFLIDSSAAAAPNA